MGKYDEMSDIGIAIAVQERLEGTELLNGGKIGKRFIEMNAVMKEFDPCNRADHAWPIIFSNSIATFETVVAGDEPIWVATTNLDKSWLGYGTDGFDCYHKNPLRAAMIVFLMMQEATNG